ncbi:MAG: hypothetical protein ACYC9M_14140 [Desulfobulbaceae bacterium]
MKRSRHIGLILMASISLAACDSGQETQQALYQNRQDCTEDWGNDECEDDDGDGHWHGPHYFYYGGRYHYYPKKAGAAAVPVAASSKLANLAPGAAPPRAMSTRTGSVSRGGFGKSASSFGASS